MQQQSQEEDANGGPMSPGGSSNKVRRKLPTIPVGVEPVLPASKRKGKAPEPPESTMKKGPAAKKGRAPEPPPKPSPKKKPAPQPPSGERRGSGVKDMVASFEQAATTAAGSPKSTSKPAKVPSSTADQQSKRLPAKPTTTSTAKMNGIAKPPRAGPITKAAPPPVKPKPKPKPKPKQEETVNIRGVEVPLAIRSLKQRVKEEIQIVTASRRLHLDEQEEIRRMERELEERERERRAKLELELQEEAKIKAELEAREDVRRRAEAEVRLRIEREQLEKQKSEARRKMTPPAQTLTSRMSPQASPRRGRHKRQNSDPIIAKFSPIEEHNDIESDILASLDVDISRAAREISAALGTPRPLGSRRLGTVTPPVGEFDDMSRLGFKSIYYQSPMSKSSEFLSHTNRLDYKLTPSMSETYLPMSGLLPPRSRTPTSYYYDYDDDRLLKEAKKHKLRVEINKRKKQLEENARLHNEIKKMTEAVDLSRAEFEEIKNKYDSYKKVRTRERLTRSTENVNIPMGIIRPIDYELPPELDEFTKQEYAAYREMLQTSAQTREKYFPQPSYSSTEYLAHRERLPQNVDMYDGGYGTIDGVYDHPAQRGMVPSASLPASQFLKQTELSYSMPSVHTREAPPAYHTIGGHGHHQHHQIHPHHSQQLSHHHHHHHGVVPSTMDHRFPVSKSDMDVALAYDAGVYSDYSVTTDAETSTPQSDHTPAMPLLDDVTKRSRSLLRAVGSRPLSDDFDKYFPAEGK